MTACVRNRVLRTAYGRQRVLLTDEQRRRLAVKGNARGRRRLAMSPESSRRTILRRYRLLVAQKYDGSTKRRPGRPPTNLDLGALVVRAGDREPDAG